MTSPHPGLTVLNDMVGSGGDPRDLTGQQSQVVRALLESTDGLGLWLFAVHVCGCKDLTAHLHYDICEFLSKWGALQLATGVVWRPPREGEEVVESWRRLMLCIPRDCFKTTLGTRATALWAATRDPEITVGIFNEAQDNSKKWVGAIKQVVENSTLYHKLWPDRLPPGIHFAEREAGKTVPRAWKWGDTGLMLQRTSMNVSELTFEPFGIGSAHTGKHFTHKIYDDIVGESSATSEAAMQDAIHFVDHGRAIERPSDNGCELINFTRWGYADVYCWAPESRVWMADGSWKPISTLKAGDAVVGFRKVDKETRPDLIGKCGGARSTTELCITRVLACGERPSALVTHLLDDGSSFRCTEDHKFFKVWKTGRTGSDYYTGKGLTDHDYSEVKNLTRLRKVMNPFGACPDPYVAGWLGGMYDADGTYANNRITIYQSEKHYPNICARIRESLDSLGITFKEYTSTQTTNLRGRSHVSEMKQFAITTREDRTKFMSWCKPTKHLEKIMASLMCKKAFATVHITGRSTPEMAQVHWIETGTGNYICEGLASKNSHVLSKWPNDYKVMHRALLEHPTTGEPDVVGGVSIFPERFPTSKCKQMYAEDNFVFMSQRQNTPMAGRETSFQTDWIRGVHIELDANGHKSIRIPRQHFDPSRVHSHVHGEQAPDLIPLSWCDKALLIDPAPSKKAERNAEPRANNGLVVLAMDPWGRLYSLQSVPLREDPVVVMEAAVLLAIYWKLHKVGIESVNFSAIYGPLWTAILRHRYPELDLSFIPLEPKGEDKDTRIRRLVAPHREGLFYHNLDRCGYLVQELLEYPHSSTRDLVDATAYYHVVLNRPQTPSELEVGDLNYRSWTSERSAITGY